MINPSITPEQLPVLTPDFEAIDAVCHPWPADAEFAEATVGNDHYTFVYDAAGVLIDAWRVTVGFPTV